MYKSFLLRPRMRRIVLLFYLFEGCVCIDLRGRETGVSEQRLYGAYVCSVVEHGSGKRVP